jgi:hypothetical protein
LLYQRTPNSAQYKMFYTIAEDGPDGPVITVLHVRHASRTPLTGSEAQTLKARFERGI